METLTYTLSIVIPVYNRPDEVADLLRSLTLQTQQNFEVIIVEDGSSVPCRDQIEAYRNRLNIHYIPTSNGGPAKARNVGARAAHGKYLIILDSDVVLPPGYIAAMESGIRHYHCDACGGPDTASRDFTPVQKAINYAMTSFFTTGGIRGGKKRMDKFYPRSFNLGCRREVFDALRGFSEDMRFGEDIDFSLRLMECGYSTALIPEAFVFHKRRIDFRKFFKQVHNSGIARLHLEARHPGSTKIVHALPAVFTIALPILLLTGCFLPAAWLPLLCFPLLIFADALRATHSLRVACLAVPAAFVQLTGYGSGFIVAWIRRHLLKHSEFTAFKNNFYA